MTLPTKNEEGKTPEVVKPATLVLEPERSKIPIRGADSQILFHKISGVADPAASILEPEWSKVPNGGTGINLY